MDKMDFKKYGRFNTKESRKNGNNLLSKDKADTTERLREKAQRVKDKVSKQGVV